MNMQDKELEELFRLKFEEFEAEPSNGIWDNIAAKVVVNQPNRSALPFISIAASVLIMVGAGLFFIPQDNATGGKLPQNTNAKNNTPPKAIIAPVTPPAAPASGHYSRDLASARKVIKQRTSTTGKGLVSIPGRSEMPVVTEPLQIQPAVASPAADAVLAAVVPHNQPALTALPVANVEVKAEQVATVITRPLPPAKAIAAAPVKKRGLRSIRGLGDLINVVVAKVDKRKDKLIEFSNTDEDDSMLTGVNLGILKVKKEEVIATNK